MGKAASSSWTANPPPEKASLPLPLADPLSQKADLLSGKVDLPLQKVDPLFEKASPVLPQNERLMRKQPIFRSNPAQ